MADTLDHLTAPARHVEVDGDRFAYRRWGSLGPAADPTTSQRGAR
ncbi:hypothetical protein [Methylosinus sp. R-45379]|nr:hypothetical protein [Methylosinus sp. R-45379]